MFGDVVSGHANSSRMPPIGPEPPPRRRAPQKLPTIADIRALATQRLGFPPCFWQLQLSQILLQRKQTVVISTAATGSGKSVTFWLPLLYEPGRITFIVVPLKQLGQQLANVAASYGLASVNVTRETLMEEDLIKVRPIYLSTCNLVLRNSQSMRP